MAIDDQKLAYSVAELAQLSGLGRSFLYEQIGEGLLPVRKAGRKYGPARPERRWNAN